MKTIFTLLVSLLVSMAVFAGYHPKTSLIIQSMDRNDIRVVIDGRRFEPNDFHLTVQGMQPGFHSVKIYREKNLGFFTIFGRAYEMVFNSSITMRPFSNMMIVIDRFGRARIIDNRRWGGRDYDYYSRGLEHDHDFEFDNGRNYGDYGVNDRRSDDWNNRWGNKDYGDRNGQYDNRDNWKGQYDNHHNRDYNDKSYNAAMNDIEFNRILVSINSEWNETNKMVSARQIINTNYFTAMQISKMMEIFSIEKNKMEIAKLGYSKTVDKQNYQSVVDALSFRSSKEELTRFIDSNY